MVRRRIRPEDEVSLFPFLDALSGVIGILALIIAVMAVLGLHESRIIASQWTSANGLQPIFVECSESGVVIHPEMTTASTSELQSGTQSWNDFVARVGKSKSHYIVFLIRPEGIDAYWKARARTPDHIKRGFDVIDADTNLDFSGI